MMKYIDATGKTEDEAIANALQMVGLDRDEVSVEVLERAKSGFLGIGGTPAKIRAFYEVEGEEEPAAEEKAEPENKKTASAPAGKKAVGDKQESVEKFLNGLFEHMGTKADLSFTEGEDGSINVELSGEEMGALIGRRGETLDAIQHLANYAINRGDSGRTRVNIDAENYREKRSESLRRLAEKVAAKVVKYRRNITLEPMNAYERHVIHTALQEFEGVTTFSTGNEPNRRVVVAYERGAKSDYQPDAGRRSRHSSKRDQPRAPRTEEPAPVKAAEPISSEPEKPTFKEWL